MRIHCLSSPTTSALASNFKSILLNADIVKIASVDFMACVHEDVGRIATVMPTNFPAVRCSVQEEMHSASQAAPKG